MKIIYNTLTIILFSINAFAQTWSTKLSMNNVRTQHICLSLPNGKILVAGGWDGTTNLKTAEVYDTTDDSWNATTNNMGGEHTTAAAIVLANGKALVIGGYTGTINTTNCDLYNPVTDMWSAAASMTYARSYHTATLLNNGKVLVVGGFNGADNLASCELYDPVTDSWDTTGLFTTARSYHTATLLSDGKVLVAGGYNPNFGYQLSSCEIYDPQTNSWTAAASMTNARDWHAASLLANGKVMVTGGEHFNGGSSYAYDGMKSAEIYDPTLNSWTAVANIPTGISYHQQFTLANGKVLIIAGVDSTNYGSIFTYTASITYLYDVALNSLTAVPMNIDGRLQYAAVLMGDGRVIVTGGDMLADVEIFDATAPTSSVNAIHTNLFTFFPVPANEILNLNFENAENNLVELTDVKGKSLFSENNYSKQLIISTKKLPDGIYFIKVESNGGMLVRKIIVQH